MSRTALVDVECPCPERGFRGWDRLPRMSMRIAIPIFRVLPDLSSTAPLKAALSCRGDRPWSQHKEGCIKMRPITAALLMRCHALAGHRCPEQPLPVDAAVSLSGGERADGELALRWANRAKAIDSSGDHFRVSRGDDVVAFHALGRRNEGRPWFRHRWRLLFEEAVLMVPMIWCRRNTSWSVRDARMTASATDPKRAMSTRAFADGCNSPKRGALAT